jgi:hypothetical protein
MNYLQLIDYLKSFGSHKEINFTAYGDFEQILGGERSRIRYPCLWIESPEGKIKGDTDQMQIIWTCDLVVLIPSIPSDYDKHLANLAKSLDIAMNIIAKIRKDVIDNNILECDLSKTSVTPIHSDGTDNDQGFHISFTITTNSAELCHDQNKWN